MDDFADQVNGVAVLAEPVRRDLYLYVVGQREPVSRDQAAAGCGVAQHTAKFHLDKLAEEGLLDVEYRRLSGRQGPGAGRPTKLYRRSDREVSVSLPAREYDLAATLMARAIEDSARTGAVVVDALHERAAELGRELGERVRGEEGPDDGGDTPGLQGVCRVLAEHGYEPREVDGEVIMANCPFHALTADHTELVCGMNYALMQGITQAAGRALTARLDPAPDRCCVVLRPADS